jgi:hypothetical protein
LLDLYATFLLSRHLPRAVRTFVDFSVVRAGALSGAAGVSHTRALIL